MYFLFFIVFFSVCIDFPCIFPSFYMYILKFVSFDCCQCVKYSNSVIIQVVLLLRFARRILCVLMLFVLSICFTSFFLFVLLFGIVTVLYPNSIVF